MAMICGMAGFDTQQFPNKITSYEKNIYFSEFTLHNGAALE